MRIPEQIKNYKRKWYEQNKDRLSRLQKEKSKNGSCLDCKKTIWNESKRCSSCAKIGNKGNTHGSFRGKKHSKASKRKIGLSLSRLYKEKVNHPRWKEDRDSLVKSEKKHLDGRYRDWMKSVKDRDGWKCMINNCDCSGRLESHHILDWVNYPELRYEINNGITLCQAHHPKGRAEEKRLSTYFMELVSVSKE